MTIQSVASEVYAALEAREIGNSTRWFLKDDASAEVQEIVRDAAARADHPNHDVFYEFLNEAAGALSNLDESATEDDAQDAISEIEADIYTGHLTAWLALNVNHVYYLTEALEEYGDSRDGFQILGLAQMRHKHEIADALLGAITEHIGSDADNSE